MSGEAKERSAMSPHTSSRPVEPQPEDFALSAERAKRFKEGPRFGWQFWVLYCGLLVFVLAQTWPFLNRVAAILIVAAWPVTLFIGIMIPLAGAQFYSRFQPGYTSFRLYDAARKRYQSHRR
jgi:hypothetical protein